MISWWYGKPFSSSFLLKHRQNEPQVRGCWHQKRCLLKGVIKLEETWADKGRYPLIKSKNRGDVVYGWCQSTIWDPTLSVKVHRMHIASFDWFLSGLEWILNFEFCLLKLLIFYQKLLRNIRSRLKSSTFWVFEPVIRYVW